MNTYSNNNTSAAQSPPRHPQFATLDPIEKNISDKETATPLAMSLKSKADELISQAVEARRVPAFGAVSLDKSGEVLYEGAFGTTGDMNDGESHSPFTTTTQINIWSMTKLVTSVAILQLLETGQLGSLDDDAAKYVPDIGKLPVLQGWTSDDEVTGHPITRPATKTITIRHLLTHTSGIAYDFSNRDTCRWFAWRQRTQGIPRTNRKQSDISPPLVFEPGTSWAYGYNTDWLGLVVEAITGIDLETYFQQHILGPLGLNQTGQATRIKVQSLAHMRSATDRSLALPPMQVDLTTSYGEKDEKEIQTWGGAFLVSTLRDYATFLLTILNHGTHPTKHVQILKAETVRDYLFTDQLPLILGPQASKDAGVGEWDTSIAWMCANGVFMPENPKGFSTGLMLNLADCPGARKTHSGAWAGISNQYYWVDPQSGKLGVVAANIFPFMDVETLDLFDRFEKLVYQH
ncbi:hypothetical protein B0A52_06172 [Exophiala mesophila]|uniref:Beta-lactamase-related domain-containing protein n=1 Tax=Exophiala mesophila TaxID=212818 RepID=A0A438N2P3_EXOME|nr:hypothetical protein B0A52_06172 [Exophiala mesophila]